MTSGLVNASFGLPEWQAVKMIFFAPWIYNILSGDLWCKCHKYLNIISADGKFLKDTVTPSFPQKGRQEYYKKRT